MTDGWKYFICFDIYIYIFFLFDPKYVSTLVMLDVIPGGLHTILLCPPTNTFALAPGPAPPTF